MTVQEEIDKQRAKVLWCTHVLGPDEVHAMPDYATAEQNVAELAMALYTPRTAALDVLCLPIVAVWPHSERAHREDLKRKSWLPSSDARPPKETP
jgi:hypothetical protein